MHIIHTLQQTIGPNPVLFKAIMEKVDIVQCKKGTELLGQGGHCHKLYYVEKGLIRMYYLNEDGKDITHWFAFESAFLTEADSFFDHKPSLYFFETLEDSTLITLSLAQLNELFDTFPVLERFGRIFGISMAVEMGDKLKDLQFRSAEDRYRKLIEKYPDILNRVALGHIASFLGITQPSLSRIRSKM